MSAEDHDGELIELIRKESTMPPWRELQTMPLSFCFTGSSNYRKSFSGSYFEMKTLKQIRSGSNAPGRGKREHH